MWPAYKGEGGGKLNASAKRDRRALTSAQRSRFALAFNFPPPSPLYAGHAGYWWKRVHVNLAHGSFYVLIYIFLYLVFIVQMTYLSMDGKIFSLCSCFSYTAFYMIHNKL